VSEAPKKVRLTIKSSRGEATYEVRRGLGFQAVCAEHETPIEFDCREADCGICIFKVLTQPDHLSKQTGMEEDFLKAMRADPDERLACQCRILGDVSILVEDY
jgi:ferredoxin